MRGRRMGMRKLPLALLALTLLALPATADAVKFKVSVKGKQVDTWSGAAENFNGGCTYASVPSGRSIYKFSTTKPATVSYPGTGLQKRVRLSVKASGDFQLAQTLINGPNAAACPPPNNVSEECPENVRPKKTVFGTYFSQTSVALNVGRVDKALLLPGKFCPTLRRFSGLTGFVRKEFAARKLRMADKLEFDGKSKETELIFGIGNLTTRTQMHVTLKRVG
jgi:hypothetical protein